MREAFVQSLIWRHPTAILDSTLVYVNAHVARFWDTHDAFLNALLTIAVSPEHPFNADFLHKHLARFDMASRDAWWSTFLYRQYGEGGPVDRLVEWAWSPNEKGHIDNEAIRLCGVALGWFLTSSHRFLRDRTTKALVTIFTSHIDPLRRCIRLFFAVDDPYVIERLLAVAYGCALRSADGPAIQLLAHDVYQWIFKDAAPPPHILLRDYARGVVEVATRLGLAEGIDLQRVRPPYRSEWPTTIPSEDELRVYRESWKDMPDVEWSRVHLSGSIIGSDDFSRYIIDPALRRWSRHRIGAARPPSRKQIYERFLKSLTPRQRRAWRRYEQAQEGVTLTELASSLNVPQNPTGRQRASPALRDLRAQAKVMEMKFLSTLGAAKRDTFTSLVEPYLASPQRFDQDRFDTQVGKRWMVKRVFDLGWTAERFGAFDRSVMSHDLGRDARKPERIGKKYQWIALHELLARLGDNFELIAEDPSATSRHYDDGPWQVGSIRDIDPSCVLGRTGRSDTEASPTPWWMPAPYTSWASEPEDAAWLATSHDLPPIQRFLAVRNPVDGSEWITLEGHYDWQQPTPPDEERYEISRRTIWYMIKAYIVKSGDADELFDWLKAQRFMGRWMPEPHATHDVFLGEFFWAPAFRYQDTSFYGRDGWTQGDESSRLPKAVLVSSDEYAWGRGYDCSIGETISISLPCKWLVDAMTLKCSSSDGACYDAGGRRLVVFDPSVAQPGPSALLIRRDALMRYLEDSGHQLVWTLLAEKNLIGGSMTSDNSWKGRLEVSGAFRLSGGGIAGTTTPVFRAPNAHA